MLNEYLTDGITINTFPDRKQWLSARANTIGGSDASSVLGKNPHKSNLALWQEKVGETTMEDISDLPYVRYGLDAEKYLRILFCLDYPQYMVEYKPNNIFHNKAYPYAHYSADGWLFDEHERFGLLEIKTANILQPRQKEEWNDRIPDSYFIQCLHGMMVTGADYVVLKAQLKSEVAGEIYLQTKHYRINRTDYYEDIAYLADEERKFMECVSNGTRPALILPTI